jgi:hypothetical protein
MVWKKRTLSSYLDVEFTTDAKNWQMTSAYVRLAMGSGSDLTNVKNALIGVMTRKHKEVHLCI